MSKEKYYNLIDFGDTKIRFSVFDNNLDEKYSDNQIIPINDLNKDHFKAIETIIKKAEKKISFHITDLILFLDSKDLHTIDITLNKNLDKKLEINELLKFLKLELNQIIMKYYDNLKILHITENKCIIDNEDQYIDIPRKKIVENNIKVDFKVICFPSTLVDQLKNSFIEKNLNLTNIFCTSFIKTKAYIKKLPQKKISFLDIGKEKTSFIFYEYNRLKHIQTIPIGGHHITKDISKILNITIEEAEIIKKSFNKSETEFSYKKSICEDNKFLKNIIKKNISIDMLKKVILYRVQEIIDLTFKKTNISPNKFDFSDTELFLIGDGSLIFKENSFYLNDKFEFKSINFYNETDNEICNNGLIYHLENNEISKIINKKQGFFEKFFNYFNK